MINGSQLVEVSPVLIPDPNPHSAHKYGSLGPFVWMQGNFCHHTQTISEIKAPIASTQTPHSFQSGEIEMRMPIICSQFPVHYTLYIVPTVNPGSCIPHDILYL